MFAALAPPRRTRTSPPQRKRFRSAGWRWWAARASRTLYDQTMRVYLHGSGRSGRDAWPSAPSEDALFADVAAIDGNDAKIAELRRITPQGSVLFAHSAGAVPAVLAINRKAVFVDALVLLEPALYDIARGMPAVEHHIDVITHARALADAGDLYGFWREVRPVMFGGPAEQENWGAEEPLAARFATVELPWGHAVTPDMIEGVRTLVITGGWNAEYEAIAAVLATHGATHQRLVGNEHRPQDHPDFEGVAQRFLES